MVVGMVANEMEGRKKPTATPPFKVKEKGAKKVSTEKKTKKVNKFLGKVEVSDVTGKNYRFNETFWDTMQVVINARFPAQEQRRAHMVHKGLQYYDPSDFDKKSLAKEVRSQLELLDGDFQTFTGNVQVIALFYFKIPNYNPTNIQKDDFYMKRPDVDNLQKFLFDALDGLFYADDSQVVAVHACKRYDDRDHVKILIAHEHVKVVKEQVVVDDSDDDEVLFESHSRRP